jgi:hypothetical protein
MKLPVHTKYKQLAMTIYLLYCQLDSIVVCSGCDHARVVEWETGWSAIWRIIAASKFASSQDSFTTGGVLEAFSSG